MCIRDSRFYKSPDERWHAGYQTSPWKHTCSQVQAHAGVSRRQENKLCLTLPISLIFRLVTFSCSHTSKSGLLDEIELKIIPRISHFSVFYTHDRIQTDISAVGRKTLKVCCTRRRELWKVAVGENCFRWERTLHHIIEHNNEAPSYLFLCFYQVL